MGCQYYDPTHNGATSFTVAMPRLTFGRNTLSAKDSLSAAGIDVGVFSDIRVEPCDDTVMRGAAFLEASHFDGVISVGGGSVIDTAKGALLVHQHGGIHYRYSR